MAGRSVTILLGLCVCFFLCGSSAAILDLILDPLCGEGCVDDVFSSLEDVFEYAAGEVVEELTLTITEGVFDLPLLPDYPLTIIGDLKDLSKVILTIPSGSCGSLASNLTLQGLTLHSACSTAALVVEAGLTLTLDNVAIVEATAIAVQVNNGALLLTNNLLSDILDPTVVLSDGAQWISSGIVEILNTATSGDAHAAPAIQLGSNAFWQSNGPVSFTGLLIPALRLNISATWKQYAAVTFQDNVITDASSSLVHLSGSTWLSLAPVELINNSVHAAHILLDAASHLVFHYTLSFQPEERSSSLFSCHDSTVVSSLFGVESENNNCIVVTDLAIAQWNLNPEHLLVFDKDGNNKRIVIWEPNGTETFYIGFVEALTESFNISIGTSDNFLPAGVSLPQTLIPITTGQNIFQLTLAVQNIVQSASNQLFTLLLEPLELLLPKYLLQSTLSSLDVLTSSSVLHLPSSTVLFPFNNPDFVFVPALNSSSSSLPKEISTTSVQAFFLELFEVENNASSSSHEQVVHSVSLFDLSWNYSSTASSFSFSTHVNIGEQNDSTTTRIEVIFTTVEAGSQVELPDDSLLSFVEDSLKWTLVLENWPFANEENVLKLRTTLRTGDEKWLSVTQEDEEEEEDREKEFVLEAANSKAFLRVLSICWTEEEFDNEKQVDVQVTQSDTKHSEVEVVFTFPTFQQSLRYDPDLSVLLANDEGADGEENDEKDDGEEDKVLLTIVLPIVLAVAVVVVVVVSIAGVIVLRRKNTKMINRTNKVNFELTSHP